MERLTTLEKVILRLEHWNEMNKTKFVMKVARPVFELILEDLKTAKEEQPKVIRCKDCKKQGKPECPVQILFPNDGISHTDDDWYCADGEAKAGEQE